MHISLLFLRQKAIPSWYRAAASFPGACFCSCWPEHDTACRAIQTAARFRCLIIVRTQRPLSGGRIRSASCANRARNREGKGLQTRRTDKSLKWRGSGQTKIKVLQRLRGPTLWCPGGLWDQYRSMDHAYRQTRKVESRNHRQDCIYIRKNASRIMKQSLEH
jgi:hypothetical protein